MRSYHRLKRTAPLPFARGPLRLAAPMRRRGRPSLRPIWLTPGDSRSPSPAAHSRLAADSAGAKQSVHRGGGVGPLARPTTRLEPPVSPASKLAGPPAAYLPPR